MPLSPLVQADAAAALAKLRAAAATARATAASYGAVGLLVDDALAFVNLDTDRRAAASRARETARKVDELAGIMAAKLPKLASDAEALTFITECGQYADIRATLESARLHSRAGFVDEVVKPSLPSLPTVKWTLYGVMVVATLAAAGLAVGWVK